jgi:3-oxoadipate enol-lactonase
MEDVSDMMMHPGRAIQLADHRTAVTQRGENGPPVLLVHSLGLDRRMWEPVLDQLSIGRRLFAYDIRGHGAAAESPRPFSLADTAADLVGVLDGLGLERAQVVGLSYGGAIAQTAAVAYPERFAALALLATTDQPFPDVFEERARSAETDGMEAQLEPSLARWFTPEAVDSWGARYARECLLRTEPENWAAAWRSMKELDVQGRLAGFEPPTLVLAGGADVSGPPAFQNEIAGRIPGSTFQELPGVPHMQTLEKSELVAQALDQFLARG